MGGRDVPEVRAVEPRTASEQSAYDKWLDQTSDRESATNDRTHGAEGVIPPQLWVVLFIIAVIIVGFVLFFADSGEHATGAGDADGIGRRGVLRDAAARSVRSTAPTSQRAAGSNRSR